MKKLVSSLGLMVALAAVSMLAGCELYFGSHDNGNDHWSYCGPDGEYDCVGNDCQWVSSQCTGQGSGYECTANTDCAAGCYCSNGTCEEGGFCTQDSDCGAGYHCNTDRSSCEPNDTSTTCSVDTDCPQGQSCDAGTGQCVSTCVCMTDADAVSQGFNYCDESRGTCMVGVDPAGDCVGDVTCNTTEPACPEGSVATISNGCYTGDCEAITSCGQVPGCSAYTHEADCLNDTFCSAVYTGINCKKPDGSACKAGDTNCTCQSFKFSSCADTGSAKLVEWQGYMIDASPLLLQ